MPLPVPPLSFENNVILACHQLLVDTTIYEKAGEQIPNTYWSGIGCYPTYLTIKVEIPRAAQRLQKDGAYRSVSNSPSRHQEACA